MNVDFMTLFRLMRDELAPMSGMPYVLPRPHGLGNRYARPDTSHSSTRDGLTYATAWGGVDEIDWAHLGADKTLWICGTWLDASITVGAEGASGRAFDIRLDHPTDPARIWNSTPIPSGDWTASGVNGEYWADTVGGGEVDNGELILYVDGERARGCSKASGNTRNIRFDVAPISAVFNATDSSITFASVERTFVTGDKVVIPSAGDELSIPPPLARHVQYYVIALAGDRIQFASSYANALAGTYIALTKGAGDIWKLFHETPTQQPYLDPVIGALEPGWYWWDGLAKRIYWRPPAGVPADYETAVSLDRNATVGAAIYASGKDYVRVWGGGQYGGLFGALPKGKVGRCHTNAIQFVDCSYSLVDGVEISGCRSGIAFNGGTGHVSRGCRVKDVGWHGVGGEGGSNVETDMLHERHWISDVGRKFDWGDMQGVVFNAGNTDSHTRRCLLQRVGRNAANCNQGVLVSDASSRSYIYRNIVDDCYGEVLEAGANSDFPTPPRTNVDSAFASNIIYRQNRDLGEHATNQAFTSSLFQFRAQKDDSLLSRYGVFGNLAAYCRSLSDSGGEARGLAFMRANRPTAVISDINFTRNATVLIPLSAASWSFATLALSTPAAPNPTFTSDRNLWSASIPFLRRQRTGDSTVTYAADHAIGGSPGYWSFDSGGQDANSQVAPATDIDLDDAPELTSEVLEFLRMDDGFDALVAPSLVGVGAFPFLPDSVVYLDSHITRRIDADSEIAKAIAVASAIGKLVEVDSQIAKGINVASAIRKLIELDSAISRGEAS